MNICCDKTINYLLKSWIITFSINYFVVIHPWLSQPTIIIRINIFVFNLIDYPITIFWWRLAIKNLIRRFLIWSYSHICWIGFFSFYFYKYFLNYWIFSFCCLISQINNIFFKICSARKNINKSARFSLFFEIFLIKKFKDYTLVAWKLNPISLRRLFIFPRPN